MIKIILAATAVIATGHLCGDADASPLENHSQTFGDVQSVRSQNDRAFEAIIFPIGINEIDLVHSASFVPLLLAAPSVLDAKAQPRKHYSGVPIFAGFEELPIFFAVIDGALFFFARAWQDHTTARVRARLTVQNSVDYAPVGLGNNLKVGVSYINCGIAPDISGPKFVEDGENITMQMRAGKFDLYVEPWPPALPRDLVGLAGMKGGLLCINGSRDSRCHSDATEHQPHDSQDQLPPGPSGTVESRVGSFPLGAKIGLAVVLSALASLIWARGNWLFWDGRASGRGLLGYGVGGLGILALSFVLFAWASPYYN